MGKESKGTIRKRKKSASSSSVVLKTEDGSGKKDKKRVREKTTKEAEHEQQYQEEEKDEDPTWHVIRRHPAFLLMIVLVIPYSLWNVWTRIVLQHPELVNRYFHTELRPSVQMDDPRQLLIIGSMSSGTSQIAQDFIHKFHMEIGHEDSDTGWKFVRDGTVSWFHGIRYLDPSKRNLAQMCQLSWKLYSSDKMNFFQPFSNYGIGPDLFGPPHFRLPLIHPNFHTAFHEFCQDNLEQELGCGMTGKCRTPFQRTLVQTRQPWKIVTSLVAKYCYHGSEDSDDDDDKDFHLPTSTLLQLFFVLFPYEKWFYPNHPDLLNLSPKAVCTNQMASYVWRFYSELFNNTEQDSSLSVFPIETTPICQVAENAGLLGLSNTVYPPNHQHASQYCQEFPDTLFGRNANRINQGRLTEQQLLRMADPSIAQAMKALYKQMGYQYPQI